MNDFYSNIRFETKKVITELLEAAKLDEGDIFVVGCSSSEIVGEHIGKGSSPETANVVFDEIYSALKEKGIYLAAQCCEHLNRALIIEKECAQKYGYEIVNVKPQPKAGGSFATAAYNNFEKPVAIEHIKAHAGLDIGGVLIGMHLKEVAVPMRLTTKHIGNALIIAARTRPKFTGGERACYDDSLR
jgi:uncharacterized protein (TIGR01440 family)